MNQLAVRWAASPLWLLQGAGGLDVVKEAECSCGDAYMHVENWQNACLAEEASLLEACV